MKWREVLTQAVMGPAGRRFPLIYYLRDVLTRHPVGRERHCEVTARGKDGLPVAGKGPQPLDPPSTLILQSRHCQVTLTFCLVQGQLCTKAST